MENTTDPSLAMAKLFIDSMRAEADARRAHELAQMEKVQQTIATLAETVVPLVKEAMTVSAKLDALNARIDQAEKANGTLVEKAQAMNDLVNFKMANLMEALTPAGKPIPFPGRTSSEDVANAIKNKLNKE